MHGLGLEDIESVEQLLRKCKRLEAARELASRPRGAFRDKVCLLEPDLAYQNAKTERKVDTSSILQGPPTSVGPSKALSCWNCGAEGHSFSKCKENRKKKFCFRCGRPDVTKYSCSCNPKNGDRDRR